jgi:hypothetical protein
VLEGWSLSPPLEGLYSALAQMATEREVWTSDLVCW